MDPFPLPATDLLGNAHAVAAVFGQVNFYDAELRAVRLTLAPGNIPVLEADLHLPAAFAGGIPEAARAAEYRVTLRCEDTADLTLADFGRQNVVGEYALEAVTPAPADERRVRVTITGAVGCDLALRCRAVSAAVAGLAVPAAAA